MICATVGERERLSQRTASLAASIVCSWPLVLTIAMAAGPVVASPAGGQQIARRPLTEQRPTLREAQENTRFKLRKAMKSGEVWTSLWFGYPRCQGGGGFVEGPLQPFGTFVPSPHPQPGLVTKVSNYVPGAAEPSSFVTFQYDRQGNQIVQEWTSSYSGVSRSECEYADRGDLQKGLLISMKETRNGFPSGPVYRATYNARDQHELETEQYDFDHDGTVDAVVHTRYIYDRLGLLVEEVGEWDDDADGTIDYRAAAKATYEARQRMQRIVKGYYEFPGGPFIPIHTFVVVFDDAARSAVATDESDYDGDGISDFTTRVTKYSDEAGRIIHSVRESDYYGRPDGGADGVADSLMLSWHEWA